MKQYNYKRKNKYRGIKVSKYEEEKKTLEQFRSRQKKELETLSCNILEEKTLIMELENKKQEALVSGNQEDFLKLSDELRKSKDSLEFYTERRNSLKEISRVKEEEVLKLSSNIREEQSRLNKDSLKWVYEELQGIVSVLAEVNRELSEGDKVLFEALQMYKSGVSEEEYLKTITKIKGYSSLSGQNVEICFPEKSVIDLLNNFEGNIKYLEQPKMKKWLED